MINAKTARKISIKVNNDNRKINEQLKLIEKGIDIATQFGNFKATFTEPIIKKNKIRLLNEGYEVTIEENQFFTVKW